MNINLCDKEVTEEEIKKYEEVRKFFINNPDESLLLPLADFLRSEDQDIEMETITTIAQLALNHIKVHEIIKIITRRLSKYLTKIPKNLLLKY